MRNPKTTALLASIAAATVVSNVGATRVQYFRHGSQTEFETGTLENVVATNFGELKLARAVESILGDEGAYASVDALAETADGTVYIGTTAHGKLLSLKDGKTTEIADFGEAAAVAALKVTASGDLLIGVGGESAELKILKSGATKPETVVNLGEEAAYIWGITLAADNKAYLATGPNGQLVEVDVAAKTSKVIYDSDEDNLRSVVAFNDSLFVGTDPHGLILKIDRGSGKAFVVYDAPESEVSTLLIDAQSGQIYAGTSQLVEAPATPTPDAATEDATTSTGRPTAQDSDAPPIEVPPAEPPKPNGDESPDGDALKVEVEAPSQPQPTSQPSEPTPSEPAADAGPQLVDISSGTAPPAPGSQGDAAADGNAVYRIDAQGFVSEVFRAPVMVFGLAKQDGVLYVATGPTGVLYQLDPAKEEFAAIAKSRSANLTSVLATNDGRVMFGSANSAELSTLGAGTAKEGTFTSPVLDATQISAFGKLQVRGAIPEGTSATIATRSSNVEDQDAPLWSDWSAATPVARFVGIDTPAARYVQYRVTLAGDGKQTPTLDEVALAYQQPNVGPRIDAISVPATAGDGSAAGAATPMRSVSWTATDPNADEVRYTLSTRAGAGQPWVPLAKDLTDSTYEWDTRRVPDGRYEVKVEASDALANSPGSGKVTSRVSDPTIVDNTPPAIGDVSVTRENGKTSIALRVADRAGAIASLEYAIDGDDHWQTVLPSDMLNDSPDEQYVIVLPDAGEKGTASGATRVVSLRAKDENGNTAHESVTVKPEK